MNFTREPIIETVITPREGCKLAVRSSKANGQEDYFVDAVEVVSFGHSFFFRSQERPKSFLVPVSDYEILELKETRMVLKSVSTDRSIKIGGGREASRAPRESAQDRAPREEELKEENHLGTAESRPSERSSEARPQERQMDRKRDRRRRSRRGRERGESVPSELREAEAANLAAEESSPASAGEESPKAPSFISKLFPPPSTLIKDTISRYKVTETKEETTFLEEKPSLEEDDFEEE